MNLFFYRNGRQSVEPLTIFSLLVMPTRLLGTPKAAHSNGK